MQASLAWLLFFGHRAALSPTFVSFTILKVSVLGFDPPQRLRLQRTLIAGLIYLASCVAIALGMAEGLTTVDAGFAVMAYELAGFLAFFLSIRFGLTQQLEDPALTLPQVLHGLGAIVLAYLLIPAGRNLTLPLLSLALTFALLSKLTPRQTTYCGLAAAAMLVVAFMASYLSKPNTADVAREAINLIMAALTLPVFSSVARQVKEWRDRLDEQKAQLQQLIGELRELAARDELTGLVNRRAMNTAVLEELMRFKRHQRAFCLAILDIDNFKRINDQFGHQAGDAVLQALARHLTGHFAMPDHVARWGGEEFVILLPECTLDEAIAMLDAMRAQFGHVVGGDAVPAYGVTFSTGVTQACAGDLPTQILERADAALYQAKRQGKNKVVSA